MTIYELFLVVIDPVLVAEEAFEWLHTMDAFVCPTQGKTRTAQSTLFLLFNTLKAMAEASI